MLPLERRSYVDRARLRRSRTNNVWSPSKTSESIAWAGMTIGHADVVLAARTVRRCPDHVGDDLLARSRVPAVRCSRDPRMLLEAVGVDRAVVVEVPAPTRSARCATHVVEQLTSNGAVARSEERPTKLGDRRHRPTAALVDGVVVAHRAQVLVQKRDVEPRLSLMSRIYRTQNVQ